MKNGAVDSEGVTRQSTRLERFFEPVVLALRVARHTKSVHLMPSYPRPWDSTVDNDYAYVCRDQPLGELVRKSTRESDLLSRR